MSRGGDVNTSADVAEDSAKSERARLQVVAEQRCARFATCALFTERVERAWRR